MHPYCTGPQVDDRSFDSTKSNSGPHQRVWVAYLLYAVFIAAILPFLKTQYGEEAPHLSYDLRLIADEEAQYVPLSQVFRHLTR